MKMKLLPYEKFEITTELPPDEVERRLSVNIEPRKIFRFLGGGKVFEGEIGLNSFKLSRLGRLRNASLIFYGMIENDKYGTKIVIKNSTYNYIIRYLIIYLVIITFLFISSILSNNISTSQISMRSLRLIMIALILFIFSSAIMLGSSLYNIKEFKKTLSEILE